MTNKIFVFGVLLVGTVCPSIVQAQTSGLAFLRLGTNAAAAGQGDAQVAQTADAFSTYWNPAGLAAATHNMASVSHLIFVADTRTYSLAARFAAGERGGLGLFVTGTSSGDLEARDRPGDPDGLFDAQFISAGASYGRQFGLLRVGLTAKYLSERIYTEDATGYAFDAGAQIGLLQDGIRVGAALLNIGKMSELNLQATPLPRTVRVGAAVHPFRIITSEDRKPLLNAYLVGEVSHLFPDTPDGSDLEVENATQVHVGAAAEVFELVTVRAGVITNDAIRRFTIGMGIGYGPFVVDYAFIPFINDFSGAGHFMTLSYQW